MSRNIRIFIEKSIILKIQIIKNLNFNYLKLIIVYMLLKYKKVLGITKNLSDCWQNDQNINEHIDVLVVFQKK